LPHSIPFAWLPATVCALSVTALLAAAFAERRALAGAAKLVAASTFLWAAFEYDALASSYGRVMLGGLFLCAVGDACLISRKQSTFLAGIGAFLLGHVAYTFAFAGLELAWNAVALLAPIMALFAWFVLRRLSPHVEKDMQRPVLAYVVVISLMVTLSIGPAKHGVFAGALAFALSDLSVARDRFVAPGFVNGAWGLPLYFAAQHVLAYTIAA